MFKQGTGDPICARSSCKVSTASDSKYAAKTTHPCCRDQLLHQIPIWSPQPLSLLYFYRLIVLTRLQKKWLQKVTFTGELNARQKSSGSLGGIIKLPFQTFYKSILDNLDLSIRLAFYRQSFLQLQRTQSLQKTRQILFQTLFHHRSSSLDYICCMMYDIVT